MERKQAMSGTKKQRRHDKTWSGDGWNINYFESIGLNEWLNNCNRLKYEIDNCRRGSYFSDKTTGKGMLENIESLKEELNEVIETMRGDV